MNTTDYVSAVNLQCVQCSDRCTVSRNGLHRVRHWCWLDDATGLWCSMGWAVDE